jgi:hypothetical protein
MKRLTGKESLEELQSLTTKEEVHLSASALSVILTAFANNDCGIETIQQKADALERESVDYEEAKSALIAQALFEFSSPEINGVVTQERCAELIAALKVAD